MSRTRALLLQTAIILLASLVPALLVWRAYPSRAETLALAPSEPAASVSTKQSLDSETPPIAPSSISIPSLDLVLPVDAGVVADNSWTLFDDRISWLSTSAEPGEGNVILYAHNRPQLFGGLHDVLLGDRIVVEHEGWEYAYAVIEVRRVSPQDTDVILASRDQLTLYTCDGSFDQKRLVVIARPA